MKIRKCKKCGTVNPENAIACSKCCDLLLQDTLLELPDQPPVERVKSDPFSGAADRVKSDPLQPSGGKSDPFLPFTPPSRPVTPTDSVFEPYPCPRCGAVIRQANMRFCNHCGAALQSMPAAGTGTRTKSTPPYTPPYTPPVVPPPGGPTPYIPPVSPAGPVLQGITCYVPGCMNAVTAQCRGYPAYCGRMVCAAHSHNGLCPDCAAREAAALQQNQIVASYDTTLADIRHRASSDARNKPFWWTFGSSLGVGGLGLLLTSSSSEAATIFLFLASLVFAGSLVVFFNNRSRLELQYAGDADQQLPGFLTYYQQWLAAKHHQEAENAKKGLLFAAKAVGVILVIVIAGALSGSRDDHRD